MGHQAMWEATNIFQKNSPHEELDIGRGTAQEKTEPEEGEDEQAEAQDKTVLNKSLVEMKLQRKR